MTADPNNGDERKCAHQECSCLVGGGRRYCSDYCEDAADTDPTSVCTCGHAGCG